MDYELRSGSGSTAPVSKSGLRHTASRGRKIARYARCPAPLSNSLSAPTTSAPTPLFAVHSFFPPLFCPRTYAPHRPFSFSTANFMRRSATPHQLFVIREALPRGVPFVCKIIHVSRFGQGYINHLEKFSAKFFRLNLALSAQRKFWAHVSPAHGEVSTEHWSKQKSREPLGGRDYMFHH